MTQHGLEQGSGRGADSLPDLSGKFFGDSALTQSYSAPLGDVQLSPTSVESLTMTNPYKSAPKVELAAPSAEAPRAVVSTPMLDSTISQQLQGAQSLKLSTAADNQASGTQPDYRVVEGDNGQLVLEKVGDGDPLADGELNIEMDTKGKDLQKALADADKGLKEYYRELIAAWQVNHPGTDYPGWWNDILHSQPDVPADTQPVPMRHANPRPQVQPQERQPQPQPSRQAPSRAPQSDIPPMGPGGNMGGSPAGGGGGLPFMQNFGGTGRGGGDGQGAGFDQGGRYRSGGERSERASSGSTPNADQQTVLNNVKTVVEVAKEVGVDPKLAVAMMLVESGGDNRAVGDGGTSFGLFQLHKGGMLTDAGLTKEQAFDPATNAKVSLGNLAKIDQNYSDPGKAAAASQRPAEPGEYAKKVNASMDEAAELIAMAERPSGATSVASVDTTKNQHRPTARG